MDVRQPPSCRLRLIVCGGRAMNHSHGRAGVIATLAALLITGCAPASSSSGFAALAREATAEDVLPEGVVMGPVQGVEIEE